MKSSSLFSFNVLIAALFPFGATAQTLAITNGIQTYSALSNTIVTMTGQCELHVTGTNNPISGSTINLNSADAWFFLPNIRPSAVVASYLSKILVNGSAAVASGNCRVDEYAMGTVIVPQSPGYTPLQVFSGPNFAGASAQFVSTLITTPAPPLSNWDVIATGNFDQNGNFSFTNELPSNAPQQFFGIRVP